MSQEIAKLRLEKYDRKRKEYYDKYKEDHDFKVGEYVIYYKGKPGPNKRGKMKSKWKGPYEIAKIWNDGMNFLLKRGEEIVRTNIHEIKDINQDSVQHKTMKK